MNNKKFILCVGVFLGSCTTWASTVAPSESFNWYGAYIGGFLGGASGARITTTEPLRLDNNTYWFRPFHTAFNYRNKSSFIGGSTAGYNWQIADSAYFWGVEGEYGYLNEKGQSMDPNQISYEAIPENNRYNASKSSTNIGRSYGYGLLGGRIGYIQDRMLFYVKSGAVFTNIKSQYDSAKTDSTSSTGIAYLNNYGVHNNTGYGIGGGIEYALPFQSVSHLTAKLEYLYLGMTKTQLAYGHCSCDFLWLMTGRPGGIHTGKLGINYKFA